MKNAQQQLLIACLAMLLGGNVFAADPPKDAPKADAKKEEKKDEAKKDEKKDEAKKDGKDGKEPAKAEAPAEPDLPSKPYPKNATPKAFAPKMEPKKFDEGTAAAKPEEKPAEKAADKHGADKHAADAKPAADKRAEKSGDKTAEHGPDKAADKAADKHAAAPAKPAPKKRKPVAAAPKPVTDPALATVARESLQGAAPTGAYQVKAGDNLDKVIKKTMPNSPFSMEVMREAFARANPQLLGEVKAMKLKPGSTLNVPGAAVMRQVVLGDPAPQAEVKQIKAAELHRAAPVVAPTIAPTASDLNPPIAVPRQAPSVAYNGPAPEVSAEEKKKWVRFP
ncbi:MAG: hypothetical protein RL564_1977 [Pseudomonadota bacterium]|jgi:hypothetical protein